MTIRIDALIGQDIAPVIADLARLRIEVFRDWPYLYDGTFDYERSYIANFSAHPHSVVVAARDGDRIVGAATGTALSGHADGLSAPFCKLGYDVGKIFYCGESVLLKGYRGRGIGHAFFDHREAHARHLGAFTHSAFCSVVRPAGDPRKPESYKPLDEFWRKRGYQPVAGLVGGFEWRDLDASEDTTKPMQFWMRPL